MLAFGITIMVVSVGVGVITLTAVALTSPAARSAGRGIRTAMALSEPEENALAYAVEAEDVPRWALALVLLSSAGLVLGMLMVMIASIP